MCERMTWEEMGEKYPNQWVGLTDVIYVNNDGLSVESAVVKYVDKTKGELGLMAIRGTGVVPRYTTPNDTWQLGFVGGFKKNDL